MAALADPMKDKPARLDSDTLKIPPRPVAVVLKFVPWLVAELPAPQSTAPAANAKAATTPPM